MADEKILKAYIYCFDSNGYPVSEGWEFYPESSSFIADGTPAGTHIFGRLLIHQTILNPLIFNIAS